MVRFGETKMFARFTFKIKIIFVVVISLSILASLNLSWNYLTFTYEKSKEVKNEVLNLHCRYINLVTKIRTFEDIKMFSNQLKSLCYYRSVGVSLHVVLGEGWAVRNSAETLLHSLELQAFTYKFYSITNLDIKESIEQEIGSRVNVLYADPALSTLEDVARWVEEMEEDVNNVINHEMEEDVNDVINHEMFLYGPVSKVIPLVISELPAKCANPVGNYVINEDSLKKKVFPPSPYTIDYRLFSRKFKLNENEVDLKVKLEFLKNHIDNILSSNIKGIITNKDVNETIFKYSLNRKESVYNEEPQMREKCVKSAYSRTKCFATFNSDQVFVHPDCRKFNHPSPQHQEQSQVQFQQTPQLQQQLPPQPPRLPQQLPPQTRQLPHMQSDRQHNTQQEMLTREEKLLRKCELFLKIAYSSYHTHLFYYGMDAAKVDQMRRQETTDISLLTLLSLDRITSLEKIVSEWDGVVVALLFISPFEAYHLLPTILQFSPVFAQKGVRERLVLHVVFKTNSFIPLNRLRNTLLNNTFTSHHLYIDADFVPSSNLRRDSVKMVEKDLERRRDDKKLYVVPAFSLLVPLGSDLPRTKKQMTKAIRKGEISGFSQKKGWAKGHKPTDFGRWMTASQPYQVKFQNAFEPYVLISSKSKALYNEDLLERMEDKICYTRLLHGMGYELHVMHKHFVTHVTHPLSIGSTRYWEVKDINRCGFVLAAIYKKDLYRLFPNVTF